MCVNVPCVRLFECVCVYMSCVYASVRLLVCVCALVRLYVCVWVGVLFRWALVCSFVSVYVPFASLCLMMIMSLCIVGTHVCVYVCVCLCTRIRAVYMCVYVHVCVCVCVIVCFVHICVCVCHLHTLYLAEHFSSHY